MNILKHLEKVNLLLKNGSCRHKQNEINETGNKQQQIKLPTTTTHLMGND